MTNEKKSLGQTAYEKFTKATTPAMTWGDLDAVTMAGPSDAARIEQAAFERGRTAERARILGEDPNKTATKAIVADVLRHEVLTEIVMWLDERAVNTTAQLDDECDGNDAERICAQAETLTAAARALERYRDITGNRGGK